MSVFSFTAAAQRALAGAPLSAGRGTGDEIEPPELLLGLLAEEESRAATMLASRGVTAEGVSRLWPAVPSPAPSSRGLSSCLSDALTRAQEQVSAGLVLSELATEHLLLALLLTEHELSNWLLQRGLSADSIQSEILRLYGPGEASQAGPLAEDLIRELGIVGPTAPAAVSAAAPALSATTAAQSQFGELSSRDRAGVLRILDAATNRAREGLRAIEDYARFVQDDRTLTAECKRGRHALAGLMAPLLGESALRMRESEADVGLGLVSGAEPARTDVARVLTANFKRVQEALRSLEEFAKLLDTSSAQGLERLRYRMYTLERAMLVGRLSAERLRGARLYVLVDGRSSLAEFCELTSSLVFAGVHVLQLRDKRLDDRTLLDRARALRRITQDAQTLLIVNDRPDLAALCDADGVHVGQDELATHDARRVLGAEKLVGVSTHSLEQARRAVLDGADYLGVGPVFASGTKRFVSQDLNGPEVVRSVLAETSLPSFAIGGIDRDNLAQVMAAGARRIAVSGAVLNAADPAAAARELLEILSSS